MRRSLALWAARGVAADRLWQGSRIVWQRRAAALVDWIGASRREDLTGWRAPLGPLFRLALLGLLAYALWSVIRALPWLLWLLSGWWLIAAWKASRPASNDDTSEADEQGPGDDPRSALIHWLDRLTRGRSGIHLEELHQHLTRAPELAHLKKGDVRPYLDRHQVPVERTLRVDGVAGRTGVARAAIEALLQTLPPLPESAPSPAVESGSDLR